MVKSKFNNQISILSSNLLASVSGVNSETESGLGIDKKFPFSQYIISPYPEIIGL